MQEEAMLNLKWDSFSSQLTNSLDACYEKQFFVDLSLVCKNGTTLKCHKMILANASSFFRRLLVRNEHPHPMIILHDIEADDLKTIINFMYCGEIQVVKSEVKRILRVAEILEVSGLKDIRSKILAPESETAAGRPGTAAASSIAAGGAAKIAHENPESRGKSGMAVADCAAASASTSNIAKRLPIASKSFWNFADRGNDAARGIEHHAKSRANPAARNAENLEHEGQVRTSGRLTANYQRGVAAVPSRSSERLAKKRRRSDEEQITWTKVLSEISKETATPLGRLCVMDEVEISASKTPAESSPPPETAAGDSGNLGSFAEVDPLDTTGIFIKQELEIDSDSERRDDYDSGAVGEEEEESDEPRSKIAASSLDAFKTVHRTSGIVVLTPKNVALMKVLGKKDSSG